MTQSLDLPLRPRPSRVAKVLRRWEHSVRGQIEAAAPLVAGAEDRIPGLLQRVTVPSRAARGDLEKRILPGAALYLELRDRVGQDRATALTGACLSADADRYARGFRLLDRTPLLYPVFRRTGTWAMRRTMSPSAWGIRWVEDSAHRVRFDMTRCYFLDTLTALGIPELTERYCQTDEVMYRDLDHLRFVRTGTLAQGCACCDFCFERRPGRELRVNRPSETGAAP